MQFCRLRGFAIERDGHTGSHLYDNFAIVKKERPGLGWGGVWSQNNVIQRVRTEAIFPLMQPDKTRNRQPPVVRLEACFVALTPLGDRRLVIRNIRVRKKEDCAKQNADSRRAIDCSWLHDKVSAAKCAVRILVALLRIWYNSVTAGCWERALFLEQPWAFVRLTCIEEAISCACGYQCFVDSCLGFCGTLVGAPFGSSGV